MTRSARSAWSFLSTIGFSVISMGLALLVTPVLLRELGPARLGASRAVMDWVGYLTLLELGLNGAIMPLLGRALARDDVTLVKATLRAGFKAYFLVLIPMLVGACVLALAITRLVKVDSALHHELRLACVFASVPLLLMPLAPLRALIEASQRAYVLTLFIVAQSVTIAVTSVVLAKAGWGITGQSIAIALGAAVYGVFVLGDARRNARAMLPSRCDAPHSDVSREIWNLNTATLIINVCGRVGLLTDNIVIGAILSAPVIVPFLMTQRLSQIVSGQLQAVGSASWAGLAQLHARGERALFRDRFLELNQLLMVLGLMTLMPIVAYNHAFVVLWLGEASYGGLVLTSIAACNALVLAIASLWGWLFAGTGQVGRLVPVSIASACVNLVVSVGFTWFMSKHSPIHAMWGPVLGTAAAVLLVTMPVMPLLMRQCFEIPARSVAKALAAPLVVAVPFFAALMWLASHHAPRGWLTLATHMASAALVFAALCWVAIFNPQDRARWLHRVQLTLGRVPPA